MSEVTGELLMREGIFVLLRISQCCKKRLWRKASMKQQPYTLCLPQNFRSHQGIGVFWDMQIFMDTDPSFFFIQMSLFSLSPHKKQNRTHQPWRSRSFSLTPSQVPWILQVQLRSVSRAVVQRKWEGKTARHQKHHCGPKYLIMSDLQIPPHHRWRGEKRVTYITANQKEKRKKHEWPHSLLLHSTLSISPSLPFPLKPFPFSLTSPPLVYLHPLPAEAWRVIGPHSNERNGAFSGFRSKNVAHPSMGAFLFFLPSHTRRC